MLQEHVRRTIMSGKVSLFFPATVSPCSPLLAATTFAILARSSLGKGNRDDGNTLRPCFGWLGLLSGVIAFALTTTMPTAAAGPCYPAPGLTLPWPPFPCSPAQGTWSPAVVSATSNRE